MLWGRNVAVDVHVFILNNTCIFHRPLTRQSINTSSAAKKRIYIHVEVHNVDNCQ